jgi:hypothetical protein
MNKGNALAPTLVLLAGSCAAWAADGMDVQFHGFASEGYLVTKGDALFTPRSKDSGTFDFNEFAVNAVATPVNRLRVGVQIFAQDLGDSFNDEPQIDWAYGDYSLPPLAEGLDLAITAGRFKMGHGLYNDYRDLDMTRTSVFLPMSVYNPRFRDFYLAVNGAGVHGSVNVGPVGSLEFMAYLGTQNLDPAKGPLHDIFHDIGIDATRMDLNAVDGANVTWNTPLDGLRLKYSLSDARGWQMVGTVVPGGPLPLAVGSNATFIANHVWDNIASIEYQRGNLTLAAEYEYFYFKGFVEGTFSVFPVPISLPTYLVTRSTYLNAAYRVMPKLELQGGWQWSSADSVNAPDAVVTRSYGFTAAARYDVVDHWLIKGEYGWMHGGGLLRRAEQPDGVTHPTWGYVALKTTFDF